MTDKPDLFVVNTSSLLEKYPKRMVDDFVQFINDGLSPSQALRKIMNAHDLKRIDPTVVYDLIVAGYPNVMFFNIAGQVADNCYPEKTEYMSDKEFDEMILEQIEDQANW